MPSLSTGIQQMSGVWLDFDSTALIILIIFVLLFVILNGLVFKPFLQDADLREEKTTSTRQKAQQLREEAQQLADEHKALMTEANDEGLALRQSARVEGLHAKDSEVDAAKAEAAQRYADASAQLKSQFESARTEALAQLDSLSKQLSSKILGREI